MANRCASSAVSKLLAILLLTMVTTGGVLVSPAAAVNVQVSDLGDFASTNIHGVDDAGDVLVNQGVWRAGVVTPAPAPNGFFSPSPQAISGNGLAVGTVNSSSGSDAYWWNVSTGATATAAPVVPGGSQTLDAELFAVDDQGEAGGYQNYTDGMGHSIFNSVLSRSVGGALQLGPAGSAITAYAAINPDYALLTSSAGTIEVNRTTGVQTTVAITPGNANNALAPDGTVVGVGGPSGTQAYVQRPGAPPQGLANGGAAGSGAAATTAEGVIAGAIASGSGTHAAIWLSTGAAPLDLNSLLSPGSPWVLESADFISDGGFVAGYGTLNGVEHGYLLQLPLTVSGRVYGISCPGATCTQAGLPNQTILLQGKASTGATVSQSAVTDATGAYTFLVPSGAYTVGTTLDGKTIDGRGYDPETQSVIVGQRRVTGIDFHTCAAKPDAAADTSGRVHAAAASVSGCQATYTFVLKASIPQPRFVDPSPRAPYAVNPAGDGYRANNQDLGPWHELLPPCPAFASHRKPIPAVKWYSYYLGTRRAGLGTASVTLTYERFDHTALPTASTRFAGSVTRRFVYEHGAKRGHCDITEPVIPALSLTSDPKDKTRFELVVSWILPFSPEGTPVSPQTLAKIPGVASAVHHTVEHAAKHVPGFSRLPSLVQTAVIYVVSEQVEERILHSLLHHSTPGQGQIIQMIEETIQIEKAYNTPVKLYNWAAGLANQAQGYSSMEAVVRGQFHTVECPVNGLLTNPTRYRLCNDTELGLDVSHDPFPNYSIALLRNGKAVSTTTTAIQRLIITAGPQAAPWPSLNDSLMRYPAHAVLGGTLDMKGLWLATQEVGPSALQVAAGAPTFGIPASNPGCKATYTPPSAQTPPTYGTPATRCYIWGDGLP